MKVGVKKLPLPESNQTSFQREHLFERRVYQHPEILDMSGRLDVGLLPVDNDPQILANPDAAAEGSSTPEWPGNEESIRPSGAHSGTRAKTGEHLWGHGQTEHRARNW